MGKPALKFAPQATKVAPFPLKKFKKFVSHIKIHSRDYGRVGINFLGSQLYILDEVCRGLEKGITSFIILKGRAQGVTTLFMLIDFFYALEHPGLLGTFVLHEEKALGKWRAQIEMMLASMPPYILVNGKKCKFRPKILKHNRDILLLGNDSSFSYLVGGVTENKGGGLGRSLQTNFVHLTESAFYANEEDLTAFMSSISSIYEHRLEIEESTANSFNHFYDRCQDAKKSKTVIFIFSGWWRDERNAFHSDDPRFQAFAPNNKLSPLERERVRAVRQQYGFEISLQQIAWYRWKLNDKFHGDQTIMDQEFPFTEEDAFQSTGSKYFTAPVLTQITRDAHRHPFQTYKYKFTRRWEDIDVYNVTDLRAELRVWEHSSKFGYYVVACDPAYGSSDQADNNCVQVWRAFAECIVQVAEYCTNEFGTYQTAWVIAHLAGFYGQKDSRVILEINGPGMAVFTELKRVRDDVKNMSPTGDNFEIRNCLNNMRDFYWQREDSMSGDLAYHIRADENINRAIMARFKSAVELGRMEIRSLPLIEEMRRLVNDEGSISADGGGNDDRAVTAAMAHECWRKWLQPMLIGMRMTREKAMEIDARGGDQPIDRLVSNYLKRMNIAVPTS
jgi:hypothetical protein